MSKPMKRILSVFLTVVMLSQMTVSAFAEAPRAMTITGEDGNEYTYNSDGSVTVKVVPVPSTPAEPDPAGFMRDGQDFTGEYNGLEVEAAGVYSDGSTLVSVASEGLRIEFYPETAEAEKIEMPETVEEDPVPEMLHAPLMASVPATPAEEAPVEDIPTEDVSLIEESEIVAEEPEAIQAVETPSTPETVCAGPETAAESPEPDEQPEEPISTPQPDLSDEGEQHENTEPEDTVEIPNEGDNASASEIYSEEPQDPVPQPQAEAEEDTVDIYPYSNGIGQNYSGGLYGSVLYPAAINEYTDVEIVSTENGVKENIILRKFTTSQISYVLSFGGLIPAVSGSTIYLYDKDGQNCGMISAPFLADANGAYNSNIAVSLESIGGGQYRLTYSMDRDWLEAAAYPVVLDPTVHFVVPGENWNYIEDNYITLSQPGVNHTYTQLDMYCNADNIPYIRPVFPDSIKNIGNNLIVKNVTLYTYVLNVYSAGMFSAHQVLGGDWKSTSITAGNAPVFGPSIQSKSISSPGWVAWDITEAASTWFNALNQLGNYGIAITGDGNIRLHSSDDWTNLVYYEITYCPNPSDPAVSVTANGNALNSGTGYLDLSWNAVSDADSYYIALFNGKGYQYFNVGNVTSWMTKGKGLWPTESEIASGRYLLHTDGAGADLPCIPSFAYANGGSSNASDLNYYVRVIPANRYGQAPNPDRFTQRTVKLPDRVPPREPTSITVEPSNYTNADTVTVNWTGIQDYNGTSASLVTSLGTGKVQYSLDSTGNWQDTSSSSGDAGMGIDVTSLADGKHVVYIRGRDAAGNTGASSYAYFYIDRTAPTAPVVSVTPNDWTKENSVSVTWSGISDLNELSRVEYSIDGGAYVSTGITDYAYSGYTIDISSLTSGEHTISLRGVDVAGNNGVSTSVTFKKDTVAPSVASTVISPDSWTNENEVILSWTGLSDIHSGMKLVWYRIDSGENVPVAADANKDTEIDISSASDGKHTITLHFEDNAGNYTEKTLDFYADKTDPALTLLSPTEGRAVNGSVEIRGSIEDTSLDSWKVTAIGEDGTEHTLSSGTSEKNNALLGVMNCARFEDGERVKIVISAEDKAGNRSEVTGAVVIVDKSAVPVSGTVTIETPADGDEITEASVTGEYSVDYTSPEQKGLLYIDGVYAGETSGKTFPFDAISYEETSSHSISVLSEANDGTVQFSGGLSSVVLLSDAFETAACTSSADVKYNVLSIKLDVIEDVSAGSIAYFYSADGGSTWNSIIPGEDIPLLEKISSIQLKAEASDGAVLHGWTLNGVIETAPTTVSVKLLRDAENISVSKTSTTTALTELAAEPENTDAAYMYVDGVRKDGFVYDARPLQDSVSHSVALLALNDENDLYGTGAEASVLFRENLTETGTIERKIECENPIYALRLEALASGSARYYYSADNETWIEIQLGDYVIFDSPTDTVYLKAEVGTGTLQAWHVEGVSLSTSSMTAALVSAPQNVTAADWSSYYANKNLWRYDLKWADPTPADNTVTNSIAYEIYRNGVYLATATATSYTDNNYIAGARYTVRTVRDYGEGYDKRVSSFTAAAVTKMQPPEKQLGVDYTAQEQAQSEYLNKLYGGNYTFSDEDKAPTDSHELNQSLLGRNKLCANGFEPINFDTGNFFLEASDGSWTGSGLAQFDLIRTYNTQSSETDGPFGAKWAAELSQHLVLYRNGDVAHRAPDGAETIFRYNNNGSYTGGENANLTLKTTNNEYRITDNEEDVTYIFTGAGLLKKVEYKDGSGIELRRDENGLITAIELSGAGTFKVECDKNGHITEITTPGGSTLKYTYNGRNLTSFTDAAGNTVKYVYDGKGRMTEWYDADGNRQVKNTYDNRDRVIKQLDANGGEYSIEYFADHTVTTDAEGNISEIWYDEQRRTVKTVDANGSEVLYDYDAYSNIIAITDENGNTTRYEYDASGRKTKETAPDGTFYSLEYDVDGNLVKLTDQLGSVTTYEYDANKCLIKETAPDGGVIRYEYNADRQLTKRTDALGSVTEYEYDGANLISSTDANGGTTRYEYDSENRLAATTDALGHKTQFEYDSLGNLTKVTFADGSSFTYEYSPAGKLLSTTDALGNVTAYEYDAIGNLIKTTDAIGNETVNGYDKNGNVISTVDANGGEVTAEYDAQGHLMSVTDAMGNTTRYEYDKTGKLIKETNALGGETKYAYDVAGQLTAITTPAGDTTSYTYDPAGRLLTATAPNGGVTAYEYDSLGRKTAAIDPNGGRTEYTYDAAGRITKTTAPNGSETAYTYDAVGNVLSVTDALGNTTEYGYDAVGRIASLTDPNGGVTEYKYDVTGNLIAQTDAEGNVTSYEYDANGSITALIDALGGKRAMEYDAIGNVISVLQANGGKVKAEYDALGRLLSETDALGHVTGYEYNPDGSLKTITDAKSDSAETEYDALGNVTKVTSPDGSVTEFAYDLSGRLISETEPAGKKTAYTYADGYLTKTTVNGNETAFEYDKAGNILSVTDAEGRRVEFTYDGLNNLTETIYPDGSKDSYEYNALGWLTKSTPRTGEETEYSYDALGNVLTQNVGGQVTSYEYDTLNRLTAVITADGARTEYDYDALGNLTAETDALGNTTSYAYTVDSLLSSITYANGGTVKAKYDLTGNLISETDPEGNNTKYTFDEVGRITVVTDALGNTTSYTYDAADNLTKVSDALGHITAYTYDKNGNLTSETDALGNVTRYSYTPEGWLATVTDGEGNVTRYTYDKTGNVLTADCGDRHEENSYNELGKLTTVTTSEGVTEYQYDEHGYLISVTEPNGNTVSYTYDEHGNRTSMTYPDGKKAVYTYDAMNRLISVKGADGKKTTYTYDLNGQRIGTDGYREDTAYTYDEVGNLVSQITTGKYDVSLNYTYDHSGRMISESRTENGTAVESSYIYDAIGQLTEFTRSDGITESYTYDPAGNMLSKTAGGIKTNYTYNAANQLVDDGTYKYTYDKIGNLVEKAGNGGLVQYAYNALNLLEKWTDGENTETYTYNAAGLISTVTNNDSLTTLTWDTLYGEGVVISAAENGTVTDYTYGLERISASTGRARTEYVYDGRGSVIGEVTKAGLLSTAKVTTKAYTPFGEQIGEAASGFGWNGEYYNATTGQAYLRARFYEPEMNRFGQKDILRGNIINGTSLNRYAYCVNDPVNFIDPSGESLKTLWNSAKNFVSTVSQTYNTVKAEIKTTVQSAAKKVLATAATTYVSAQATVQATKTAVVTSVASSIKNGDGLKQTVTNAIQAGATTLKAGATATAAIATSGAKSVQQTVSAGAKAVKETVTQSWDDIKSTGKEFLIQTANTIANQGLKTLDILSDSLPLTFGFRPKTWIENYFGNIGVENSYNGGLINDQLIGPISKGRLGRVDMSGTGCEVIAVYNALTLKDVDASIAKLVLEFELTNAITSVPFVVYGEGGSNPYSIGDVLTLNGQIYSRVNSIQGMDQEGVYIMSFWNNNDVLSIAGLHTIAVTVDAEGNVQPYNKNEREPDEKVSFESFVSELENGFITGYYLGQITEK